MKLRTKLIAAAVGVAISAAASAQMIYGNTFPFWNVNGPLTVTGTTTLADITSTGTLNNTGNLSVSGTVAVGTNAILASDAANSLGLRNSTNAQTLKVYTTYTDASNNEYFGITTNAGAATLVAQDKNGTGTQRGLNFNASSIGFKVANSDKFSIGANDITFTTDNAFAIGRTATFRPSSVFAGTLMQSPRFSAVGGTTPTMGACGTSPSVTGNDSGMLIVVGTGGSATSCAVTFSSTFTTAPVCVAQNNTDKVSYTMVTTATTATITATAAFTASSKFHLICLGQ